MVLDIFKLDRNLRYRIGSSVLSTIKKQMNDFNYSSIIIGIQDDIEEVDQK